MLRPLQRVPATDQRPDMTVKNPKRYSIPHGVSIGAMTLVATFVSLCFDFGNGSFGAGVKSTFGYLMIFGIGLWIMSAMAAGIAVLAGRWIGTTLTAILAGCLLGAFVIHAYATSQPLARFRHLVWADAPDSLQLLEHDSYRSFNDGSIYRFSFSATPDVFKRMSESMGLVKALPPTDEFNLGLLPVETRRLRAISERSFPRDTEFYTLKNIELAYMPSEQEALVMVFPRPRRD